MEINNEDDDDAMATDSSQPQSKQQLAELIQSLEHATSMLKHLSLSSNPNNNRHIFDSLTSAQLSLSSFISLYSSDTPAAVAAEEPMIADDEEEELNLKMNELLFVQNKRLKRPASPSSVVAGERRRFEESGRQGDGVLGFDDDPIATKLRRFDLVFQFHS